LTYSIADDPLVWLHRAERARVVADKVADPGARDTMLAVAAAYEEIAKRAAARVIASQP
jgi:hypothetical protein